MVGSDLYATGAMLGEVYGCTRIKLTKTRRSIIGAALRNKFTRAASLDGAKPLYLRDDKLSIDVGFGECLIYAELGRLFSDERVLGLPDLR